MTASQSHLQVPVSLDLSIDLIEAALPEQDAKLNVRVKRCLPTPYRLGAWIVLHTTSVSMKCSHKETSYSFPFNFYLLYVYIYVIYIYIYDLCINALERYILYIIAGIIVTCTCKSDHDVQQPATTSQIHSTKPHWFGSSDQHIRNASLRMHCNPIQGKQQKASGGFWIHGRIPIVIELS